MSTLTQGPLEASGGHVPTAGRWGGGSHQFIRDQGPSTTITSPTEPVVIRQSPPVSGKPKRTSDGFKAQLKLGLNSTIRSRIPFGSVLEHYLASH